MATRITARHVLLTVTVLSASFAAEPSGRAGIRGGCAKVNVTPPLGIPLIGSKGQPSDSVMDELYAKAMVISDGESTIAILSADLLYTPLEELTHPVRRIVRERIGLPASNVMVCATHTHSGPEVFTRSKVPREGRLAASQIDRDYRNVLVNKMAGAILLAHRNMQDARIGAAVGRLASVLYNRRPTDKDGRVQMAFTLSPDIAATQRITTDDEGNTTVAFVFPSQEDPLRFGPIDPDVFVLRMEDRGGRMIGSLVGFGCHPVCVYPHLSTTISADYPHHATRVVEQVEGGVGLFALGLAGNTVPLQRGPGQSKKIGRVLGAEALKQLQDVGTADDATLRALRKEMVLPVKKTTTQEDAQDRMATEIQVLRLGDIYILGLPGEVLVEVGLQIKRRAQVPRLVIVTVANDTVGYICDHRAYAEGGYEPTTGTLLAKGAGETVIEHALALINEIK